MLFREGELLVKAQGSEEFVEEESFKRLSGLEYGNHLLLDPGYYDKTSATIEGFRIGQAGLAVDRDLAERAASNWVSPLKSDRIVDYYEQFRIDSKILRALYSYDQTYIFADTTYEQGIYVPEAGRSRLATTGATVRTGVISVRSRRSRFSVGPCLSTGL